MELNMIKEKLKQHYGSETMYKGAFSNHSVHSEGVKDLLEMAQCYWLYDIIQTEIIEVLMKHNIPDNYYLKLTCENSEMDIVLSDYKSIVLFDRHIGFTTFPEGEITLHVGYGEYGPVVNGVGIITCLPSEN